MQICWFIEGACFIGKTRGDNENYVPKNDGQAADGNDPAATVLTANYQKFTGVKETSLNETSASAVYSLYVSLKERFFQ